MHWQSEYAFSWVSSAKRSSGFITFLLSCCKTGVSWSPWPQTPSFCLPCPVQQNYFPSVLPNACRVPVFTNHDLPSCPFLPAPNPKCSWSRALRFSINSSSSRIDRTYHHHSHPHCFAYFVFFFLKCSLTPRLVKPHSSFRSSHKCHY